MASIKSVVTLMNDGDWIESKDQSPTGIRLIQTGNIGNGEYLDKGNRAKYISEKTFHELDCTEVVPGDILISRLPDPIGRACIVPHDIGKAITAVDCTIVRLNRHLCNAHYFVYYTQSELYQHRLEQFFAGTTRTRISRKNLEQIEIPLPAINIQEQIAAKLDKVTELIFLRKQQIAKLDELVKARFVEMFEGKYESLILGDVLKTTSGGTPSKTHSEYYENGTIPWLSSGEVNAGIISTVKSFITQAGVDNSSAKMIPENSVVIAMYGATAGQVGLLRIATTTNQAVCSVLPDDRYIPEYLYYAIKSKKEWMIGQCAGGAQPNISQGVIKRMKIINAPYDTQSQFAAFVAQTDQQKSIIQHSLAQLELLKKALMQKYFG